MPDPTSPDTTPSANGLPHPAAAGRAATNRANAQRSTGPRSDDGKRRSSLNALRHGLTGQTIVLPSDDLHAYQLHLQRFNDDLQPEGIVEQQLVQSLADAAWRLNRVAALENNLLSLAAVGRTPPISADHPEAHTALALAQNLHDHNRTLNTLSMHGQRLSRQFQQTVKLLRDIQAERRYTQEARERNAAYRLRQHLRSGSASAVASFSRPALAKTTSAFSAPSDPPILFDSTLDPPLALAGLRRPPRIEEIRTR